MKKVISTISILVLALMLAIITAVPVMAADEQSLGASASVNSVVSITLVDEGTSGINFGSQNAGSTYGDQDQSDGIPAVQVSVENETSGNVDIGIKGVAGNGTLSLSDWQYSLTFNGTKTGLTVSYVEEYTDVGVGDYDFYHWVTIPAGETAGANDCTVYYKAVATGGAF